MHTPEQQLLITEDNFIPPLVKVLNETTPKANNISDNSGEISQSLNQSLSNLFPEQQFEEKDVQRVRKILGRRVFNLSQEQIKDIAVEVQYMATNWLDEFERKIFNNLTLNELLHERGGL
jgi:hypothetical protein